MSNVKTTIQNGWDNAVNAVKNAGRNIVNAVKNAFSDAISAAKSFVSDAVSAGGDLITGFIDGVKAKAGALVDNVKGVVDSAVSGAKNLLGISSPSKLFKQFGEWTDEGFMQGIERGAKKPIKAMKDMANEVIDVGSRTRIEPTVDINGSLAKTNAMVNSRVDHSLGTLQINQQPANINLSLGGNNWRGFVEDITNEQGVQVQLSSY